MEEREACEVTSVVEEHLDEPSTTTVTGQCDGPTCTCIVMTETSNDGRDGQTSIGRRADHTGERGRVDHTGERGRVDHASERGRADHIS